MRQNVTLLCLSVALLLPASAQQAPQVFGKPQEPCPPTTPAVVTRSRTKKSSTKKMSSSPATPLTTPTPEAQKPVEPLCDQGCQDHQTVMQMLKDSQERETKWQSIVGGFLQDMGTAKKLEAQALNTNAETLKAHEARLADNDKQVVPAYVKQMGAATDLLVAETKSSKRSNSIPFRLLGLVSKPASAFLGSYYFEAARGPDRFNVQNSLMGGGVSPGAINLSNFGNASASSSSLGGNASVTGSANVTNSGNGSAAASAVSVPPQN